MTREWAEVEFSCNGAPRALRVRTDSLLIDVLRDDLGLTGTKLGCGTGDCGACTVLLDRDPVNACLIYAVECDGSEIETIEGIAKTSTGRIVVDQLVERGGVQCGICTPGFVVMATALLTDAAQPPDRDTVRTGLAGNLCRCTGYFPIIDAVVAAGQLVSRSGEEQSR